jgi:hypothetical protein
MLSMIKSLECRPIKKRDNIEVKQLTLKPCFKEPIKATGVEALDLFLAMRNLDGVFHYSNGTCQYMHINQYTTENLPWVWYSDALRGYLKAIRGMAGTPGIDSAKNKIILEDINRIMFCFCNVQGVDLSFNKIEELKKVDTPSIQLIGSINK